MDGEPLASVDDLQDRLSFDMTEEDRREAFGAISDLSDDARLYGSSSWLTPTSTPSAVCNLVLRAAVRHMRNPDGFVQSRAGDETLMWSDRHDEMGAAAFTPKEQDALRQYSGSSVGLYSAGVYAWGNRGRECEIVDIYVPTNGYVFPFFEPLDCEERVNIGTTQSTIREYREREGRFDDLSA